MKKLLITVNLLLLGIILFMACNHQTGTDGDSIYNPPSKCRSRMCKDYSNIELRGIISADVIQKMSLAYAADPGKSKINYKPEGGPKQANDALSLVFDLEKIKNFIWHMEDAVCRAGCDSTQQIGIRFYYIKYDTTKLPEELKSQFSKNLDKHSLVMVPAYKFKDEWYDFDYKNVKPGCKFDKIALSLNKFVAAGLINPGDGDNHGGIAPPPDPGTYPTTR
jgi:hypothetical protein